jgi:cytochrome c-type biogenesis protein CcmH
LDTDLRNGLLTQEAYEQGKRELQSRLLDEVKTTEAPAKPPRNPAKVLALALAVLLPVASVLLYLKIGNLQVFKPQEQTAGAEGFGVLRSEVALQELEKKLEKLPENPEGWLQLARSYAELKRYADAARAYQQLVKLVPNEPTLWTDYADAAAMSHDQSLLGEPTKYLNKALELDPNHTTALALSGSAAMERGDYAAAIVHWQKLVSLLPADYPEIQMIQDGIQQAKDFLAMQKGGKEKLAQLQSAPTPPKVVVNSAAALSGKVTLSSALAGKVSPTDTVFILARAAEGPKMPLAVLRKQVKDLPVQFTLDDSMAMQPQLKLSGFDKVVVVARISKSGSPMAQPGDIQGMTEAIKPGTKGIAINIDTIVK